MNLIKTFLRMPLRQKLLIPQVLVLFCWYRFRVHNRPFSELAPSIGTLGYETPVEASPRDAWLVHELMESMFRHLKWKDSCLIRALTAKKLLNRMNCRCTLYMGVAKDGSQAMTAHAWLRCGKLTVTGGDISSRYTVTAVFGDTETAI